MLALLVLPNLRWLASAAIFACKAHTTMQEITETVEEPESLFIHNEAPSDDLMTAGYDSSPFRGEMGGGHRLVKEYLDGGLLKILAMQRDNASIDLFRAGNEPIFAESERCFKATKPTQWKEWEVCRTQEREDLKNAAKHFGNVAELPPLNYRIHVRQKDRRVLFWRLYRIRQLDIYDNRNGRRIAWGRSYYRDTWWFTDLNHSLKNSLSLGFGTVQCKFRRGPGVWDLERFAEKVLFEKTKQRKQAEQPAGETAVPDAR